MAADASPGPGKEPVEHLESRQCWDLLRQVSVGRLAVWVDDQPDIFPLNYTVDHGTLVFRTGSGTKLGGALGEAPVALEADGVDAVSGLAWSVVVKGKAAPITGIEEVLDSVSLYLFPWQAGQKDHFIRITPESISGRRFKVTAPLTWWTQLSGAVKSSPE
ncbi:pyridoxamine 5'-phosphate oxidase family protein [Arthrobacter sp. ISL-65]|uniref:pyridoxamine 5'-phosphate oxidase family protein n=1 Tax=Arthrobacter sp. ISL-65 TaxID=2819112 RepID=UPI001BE5D941|nr:pyridoxamine 5'-phosphate oxidase family protein [Arthrobacter sp. ISL-65]MBT2550133.1 pyridoxamine 5'-phosphate oxidase family protein [Arthrobacter sp. ISL-65]